MEVSMAIAIISVVLAVLSFFFGRKDKGEKDTENSSYKMGQIETKIDFISKQIAILSDKFDKYDTEVDSKIKLAIENHEREYHKEEQK